MDLSASQAVKFFLPKVPFLLKTATSHTLGFSETSNLWDLRTEMIVRTLRQVLAQSGDSTVSRVQRLSVHDPGIKGPIHVAKATFPVPAESDINDALNRATEALHPEGAAKPIRGFPRAEMKPVEVEWTGYNSEAKSDTPRTERTEAEHFSTLMASTTSKVTVLYIHGGALYLMDPASHRRVTTDLAKGTGGRCVNVRYRLAPQHEYPAALLDCLVAYLSLLSPADGSLHDPVAASDIVFAGDSAGGNLCLALVQLLLQMRREARGQNPKLRFHGKEVEVPLPAGLALSSPWADLTQSMPSIQTNVKYDYLPDLKGDRLGKIPACKIWPADPPRSDLYTSLEMLLHPLVSPLAAKDWKDCPPLQITTGTEILSDEGKALVKRIHNQGAKVEAWEWEGMPHCFGSVLIGTDISRKNVALWADYIKSVVDKSIGESKYTYVKAKTLRDESKRLEELSPYDDDHVAKLMKDSWEKKKSSWESNPMFTARL